MMPVMDRPSTLIGVSPGFRDVLDRARRAASTESTILVCGETGTGKELIARTIHEFSPRRPGPFVPVDCAAVSEELFESELFGHRRGAFSGAERSRAGKVLSANGGTLFLDGVDALPPTCQARLLRTIQEREILPVGRDVPERVSFRLVSSVGDAPEDRVASGDLRRDLFFRLNVVRLRVPPLRERREDIPILANVFLRDISKRFGKALRHIDSKAVRVLADHDWPGNVRELHGVLECAAASARGETLYESDLPVHVRLSRIRAGDSPAPEGAATSRESDTRGECPGEQLGEDSTASFAEQVTEFKRRVLMESLSRNDWSYRACGDELGLAHHQVKYLCAKLGVRRARFESSAFARADEGRKKAPGSES